MKSLRAALGLLTIVGLGAPPGPAAVRWFPVVGVALGFALGGIWEAADSVWSPGVAAALVVAADAVLTGMVHLDGLADSADGLLPHLDRDRRLAVMAEPAIGAFGATVLATTMLVRWSALSSMEPEPLLLAGIWAAARAAMAVAMSVLPYARGSGLATPFMGERPFVPGVVGAVLALPLLVSVGARGGWAVAGVFGGSVAVLTLAHRRLGGFTGDVLGATGVMAETTALVAAAAV